MLSNSINDKLNEYLASELAAWQMYKQATERVQDDVIRDQLENCGSSHRHRVQKLRDCIEQLGITESAEEGVFNAFASKLAEGLFSDKEAIQLLEEEEELGLKRYTDDHQSYEHGDGFVQALLQETLLPEQSETHDAVSILRISMH